MEEFDEYTKRYLECKKLIEEDSKTDPETDPHRSRYKAKPIVLQQIEFLKEKIESGTYKGHLLHHLKELLAANLALVGVIYAESEEISKAEEYYKETLASIDDFLDNALVVVALNVMNGFGIIYSKTRLLEAKQWLEKAEETYNNFRNIPGIVPRIPCDLSGVMTSKAEEVLEQTHTYTKFYLAQVYGALKELLKSAIYCHETLKRELKSKKYDPIEWALDSATLSQFFLEKNLFKQARHHLAAASYVLDAHEMSLREVTGSQDEMEAKREKLQHRSADVSRCWSKYGIFLLEHSNKRTGDGEQETEEEGGEGLDKLWFDDLDLSQYESQITDAEVVAFEDAREVFLVTQRHLNKAKDYYTLEDRASDHVQIVQDHSQLFRHLAEFEADEERRFKMTKRRAEMLESVAQELNPRYYMDLCRKLWFELGENYHDMMQIRFENVKNSNDAPNPQTLKRINALAEASIRNFNLFLDSLKDKNTKELPDPLPEEFMGPALLAHFYLGRLHHKYVTPDKQKAIENTSKAHDCFKYLVDQCDKHEKARTLVGEELDISRQMVLLLQMKVLQLY